jgi:hypothetical protein
MVPFLPPAGGNPRTDSYCGRWTLLLALGTAVAMLLGLSYGYDVGVTGGVTGMKVRGRLLGW